MRTPNCILGPAIVIAIVTLIGIAQARAESVTGRAIVVDGDTLIVASTAVRLKGVDAAELGTALGERASAAMRAMAESKDVTCELTGEHTYNRSVGYCSLVGGADLNQAIIHDGYALACARYSDRYVADEQPSQLAQQDRAPYCVSRGRRATVAAPLAALSTASPGVAPRGPGVVCRVPEDRDSRGRRCGRRAASVRAGGQ